MNRRTFRRRNAGLTTLAILTFLTIIVGLVIVLTDRSFLEMRLSAQSRDRQTALTLAEAGVDDTVDRLRSDWTYTGGSGTLYEDPPTNTRNAGTFQTTVTTVNARTRKVVSIGTNPNGTSQGVVVLVEQAKYALGDAAIKANKDVDIGGTANILTLPSDKHVADVYSNADIDMGGDSIVDGTLYAVGTVDGPTYESGKVYAPSVSNAPPINFPTDEEVAEMKAEFLAEAQSTKNKYGNIKDTVTITAPAYINGDINIKSSSVVTINGPGVVYVNGDIRLAGQSVLVNGATLAVAGTFTQAGGTTYKITTGLEETPTMVAFNTKNESPSMTLVGGSENYQQGVIYAVSGGIKLSAGTIFVGALVAGGEDGEVTVHGNYTHLYPENMHSRVEFPGEARVIFWGETK